MTLRETILAQIETYLSAHGITESAFGRAVCGDHRLVPRLRGSGVTITRIEEAEAFMQDNPQGLPAKMPAQVPA